MKLKSLNVALAILISLGVVACKSNDQSAAIDKPKVVNSGSNTGSTGGDTGSTGSNTGSTGSNTGSAGGNTGSTGSNTGSTGSGAGSTGSNTGSTGSDAGSTGSNTGSTSGDTGSTDAQTPSTYGDGEVTVTFKNSSDLTEQERNALEKLTKNSPDQLTYEWDSGRDLPSGTGIAGYDQDNSYYLVMRDGANRKQANDFVLVVKNYTPASKEADLKSLSLNATYTGKASAAIKDDSLDILGMDMTLTLNNGNISGKGVKLDEVDEQGVGMLIETIFASAPIKVENGHITFKGNYSITEGAAVAKDSGYERKEEAKTILNGGQYDGVFAGSNGEEVIGKFRGTFNENAGERERGKENYGAFGLTKSN